ncbi:MAG: hypothetical protein PHC54_02570 [Candidatus Omnitrophica bacterium]|nr:hypothetical protein [Candidatus Omnitrophota bacterium]MDD5592243.1 hypothetical protein [Candidatus Omnitrophota bacterium]
MFGILMSGCASLTEAAKGFAGISTKVLEDNRSSAITKVFNYDYFSSYTKTLDILKRMEAYIYKQDIKKHMIAIYVSREDTTVVGLFFKEIDANNTKIEVSSPSTYAKEFISAGVFSVLDKTMTLEELEVRTRVQRQKAKEQAGLGDK